MLKSLNLYEKNGQYFLNAQYIWEDDKGEYSTNFPMIALPFYTNDDVPRFTDIRKYNKGVGLYEENGEYFLIFDRASFRLHKCDATDNFGNKHKNVCCIEETIKTKTHEMTIEEIEQKLGYKIKIVGEDK